MATKKSAGSGSEGAGATPAGGVTVDLDLLGQLPIFKRVPRRLARVPMLLDVWQRDGRLTVDEMAVMLCVAYMESGYNLNAVSDPSAPDHAVGDAWGLFQMTAQTCDGYGIDINSLRLWPDGNGQYTPEAVETATRYSGAAALKLLFPTLQFTGGQPYLPWLRARYGNDPANIARQIFIGWSNGPARGWDYSFARSNGQLLPPLQDVAPNLRVGSGGWTHYQLAKRFRMVGYFQAALGRPVAIPDGLKVDPAQEALS